MSTLACAVSTQPNLVSPLPTECVRAPFVPVMSRRAGLGLCVWFARAQWRAGGRTGTNCSGEVEALRHVGHDEIASDAAVASAVGGGRGRGPRGDAPRG